MDDVEDHKTKRTIVPAVSWSLPDGTLVELLYRPEERQTLFAIFNAGRWTLQPHLNLDDNARLVPFSPHNNLIKNEVVLLPSEPHIYGTEEQLLSQIGSFIHRYVDLNPSFERLATYYVLLSLVV
jgi:hypothetical protein